MKHHGFKGKKERERKRKRRREGEKERRKEKKKEGKKEVIETCPNKDKKIKIEKGPREPGLGRMLAAAGAEPGTRQLRGRRKAAGSPLNLRTALRGRGAREGSASAGDVLSVLPETRHPQPRRASLTLVCQSPAPSSLLEPGGHRASPRENGEGGRGGRKKKLNPKPAGNSYLASPGSSS